MNIKLVKGQYYRKLFASSRGLPIYLTVNMQYGIWLQCYDLEIIITYVKVVLSMYSAGGSFNLYN